MSSRSAIPGSPVPPVVAASPRHASPSASPGGEPAEPSALGTSTPELWAIASGKGGVGRSFLTANLGAVLGRELAPLTLVDADLGGGNLHTFLGQSAGVDGVGSLLTQPGQSLAPWIRPLELPGVRMLPAGPVAENPLSVQQRHTLLKALQQLPASRLLLDLEAGSSPAVLELFLAATRPILVVLPEPAAVEDAHRFMSRVFVGRLKQLLVKRGIKRVELTQLLGSAPHRPAEVLARAEVRLPGVGIALAETLDAHPVSLVLNQVRHASDLEVGWSFKRAVQRYFGISIRFSGAIPYDADAHLAARKRRLRVREPGSEALATSLLLLARNLAGGLELPRPEEPV